MPIAGLLRLLAVPGPPDPDGRDGLDDPPHLVAADHRRGGQGVCQAQVRGAQRRAPQLVSRDGDLKRKIVVAGMRSRVKFVVSYLLYLDMDYRMITSILYVLSSP